MGKRISKRYQLFTRHLEEKIERTKKDIEKDKAFFQRKTNSNENKTNEKKKKKIQIPKETAAT